MPDSGAGTQFTVPMRLLGPIETVDEGRLEAFYGYPDRLDRCWVRGNMIASVDGGATSDGKSGALGGSGDRALFGLMREAADVIVVGASTVRVENYSGAQLGPVARQARRMRGQAEVPPIAVLTRSGRLDRTAKLFTRAEVAPLIITSADAAAQAGERFGGAAEVIAASGAESDTVDPAVALEVFAARGLRRVLAEGGPGILGMLTGRGLLDELCLTVAPVLVGGEAQRVVSGGGGVHTVMTRSHVLADDDGYLYCRYVRAG
ncbi:pyrimidine reductase family protein [Mycolicibacterium sp. S2-37]|uniref:pyrimidine reductase family protein n=1 Tax=Mycolicibacterium sp. S2-37 TaxID=2810297 RepID=UPI001A93E40A|nr:pyrimidine reductase family protein [Mycolicibacterium sp. S2-37]MBO0676939.1 pyrimidine reductase family protein [Mycolicibacterium sp. S2-37]